MSGRKGWLSRLLLPERSDRRPAPHFAAFRWSSTGLIKESVRDISLTGAYLITNDSLELGAFVSVTLQKDGPLETNRDRRITAFARVARKGEDGVGLQFAAPNDQHNRRWMNLIESVLELTRTEYMEVFVRTNEAIGFLSRICPDSSEELQLLLRSRMSNHNISSAVDITLKAQKLLLHDPAPDDLRADPSLVIRVLEEGSRSDDSWILDFWSGLLAASCSFAGKDTSNLEFVNLFSKLVIAQVRLFDFICNKAEKSVSESDTIEVKPIISKIDELLSVSGLREYQLERDLQHLEDLKLIEQKRMLSPTKVPLNQIFMFPTALGLHLYARCHGFRGAPEDYYAQKNVGVTPGN